MPSRKKYAAQSIKILVRCIDSREPGWSRKPNRNNPDGTEMGKGINGSGMENGFARPDSAAVHSPAFSLGRVGLQLGRAGRPVVQRAAAGGCWAAFKKTSAFAKKEAA